MAWRTERSAAWLLIGLGAFLRVRFYAAGRSLWGDEANLALNLVERNFAELLEPLDFDQAAPVGFVWLVKLATLAFGENEFGLRLVPLLAALLSLPLFLAVARRCLPAAGAVLALLFFACSFPLIYYAAEVKPYALDVLWSLALLWIALPLLTGDAGSTSGPPRASAGRPANPFYPMRLTALALAGAAAMWFSFAVLLTMAGVGLVLAGAAAYRRKWPLLGGLILVGASWLGCFVVNYKLFLAEAAGNDYLVAFWQSGFMPWPPWPTDVAAWISRVVQEWLGFLVPSALAPLAGLAMLAGAIALVRGNPAVLWLLLAPGGVALFAAAAHRYPFGNRLWLFWSPACYLLLAGGAVWLVGASLRRGVVWRLAAGAILLALLAAPAWRTVEFSLFPPPGCEIRPLLAYLVEHAEPGDVVYQYGSRTPYLYYRTQERFAALRKLPLIQGRVADRRDRSAVERDLPKLRDENRVWVLLTHPKGCEPLFREVFDQWGTRLDARQAPDAELWLYRL